VVADNTRFGTFQRFGGGNVAGYRFTVAENDFRLPAVKTISSRGKSIYRRIDGSRFALFIESMAVYNAVKGITLPPGEYLVTANIQTSRAEYAGATLLTGEWAETDDSRWLLTPGVGAYATVPIPTGGTVSGFRFTVTARPDGSLPLLIDEHIDNPIILYRRSGSQWTVAVEYDPIGKPFHYIMLTPGEYLIEKSIGTGLTPLHYRFAIMASGIWTRGN
jgi:hypothetical protein